MKKGIAISEKCGIIKIIQKEVTRRTMTMSKRTIYTDIYETLFAAYRKNSATSHFLLGFAYYGEMYVV